VILQIYSQQKSFFECPIGKAIIINITAELKEWYPRAHLYVPLPFLWKAAWLSNLKTSILQQGGVLVFSLLGPWLPELKSKTFLMILPKIIPGFFPEVTNFIYRISYLCITV